VHTFYQKLDRWTTSTIWKPHTSIIKSILFFVSKQIHLLQFFVLFFLLRLQFPLYFKLRIYWWACPLAHIWNGWMSFKQLLVIFSSDIVCTFSIRNLADGPLAQFENHIRVYKSIFFFVSKQIHLSQFFGAQPSLSFQIFLAPLLVKPLPPLGGGFNNSLHHHIRFKTKPKHVDIYYEHNWRCCKDQSTGWLRQNSTLDFAIGAQPSLSFQIFLAPFL
jgi:hypothetical protein